MTNGQIENIGNISPPLTDRSLQAIIEKAYSPYKPTLKNLTREDSLLRYLKNSNKKLYYLAKGYPHFLLLIKSHPSILGHIRDNEKLLWYILRNPGITSEIIKNPEYFFNKIAELKSEKEKTPLAKERTTQKPEQNIASIQKAKEAIREPKTEPKTTPSIEPHKLEPTIISKAHIENPNTRTSIGEFRYLTKQELNKVTPPAKEKPPTSITTEKRLALNPSLLGVLSAISATVNFLKIKDAQEKRFETETQAELENAREDFLKSITEVNRSESTKGISTKL